MRNTYYKQRHYFEGVKKGNVRVRKNLKLLLEFNKKSMDRVGLESGVSKATLSRIIAGKLSPTVRTLDILADYFEVDIRDFFKD
jgi:transcriptional regulator with XRE-family HTH domain